MLPCKMMLTRGRRLSEPVARAVRPVTGRMTALRPVLLAARRWRRLYDARGQLNTGLDLQQYQLFCCCSGISHWALANVSVPPWRLKYGWPVCPELRAAVGERQGARGRPETPVTCRRVRRNAELQPDFHALASVATVIGLLLVSRLRVAPENHTVTMH